MVWRYGVMQVWRYGGREVWKCDSALRKQRVEDQSWLRNQATKWPERKTFPL